MKKILISLFLLSFSCIQTLAMCSVDSTDSVCSLPDFREKVRPIYNENENINTGINSPNGNLQPLNRANPMNEMRGPNNNLNYNSGCQFGTCLPKPNQSRLPE